MAKVILKGYIIVPDSDLAAVKAELSKHIELTLLEGGCLVFEVSQDNEDSNRFNVYEEFADQESFAVHQERVRKSKWGLVCANAVRHYHVTGVV
jgi:quinol monooxygenase YgiN